MPEIKKIEQMYAFVVEDPSDKTEGIVSILINGVWLPFVGADVTRVNSYIPIVDEITKKANVNYKILFFSNREDVTAKFKSKIDKKQTEQ